MPRTNKSMDRSQNRERRKYKRRLLNVRSILKQHSNGEAADKDKLAMAVRELEAVIGAKNLSQEDNDASDEYSEDEDQTAASDQEANAAEGLSSANAEAIRNFRFRRIQSATIDLSEPAPEVGVRALPSLAEVATTSRDNRVSVPILPRRERDQDEQLLVRNPDAVAIVDLNTSLESNDDDDDDADNEASARNQADVEDAEIDAPPTVDDNPTNDFLDRIVQQELDGDSDDEMDQEASGNEAVNETGDSDADDENEEDGGEAEAAVDDDDNVQADVNDDGGPVKLNYQGFVEYFRREARMEGTGLQNRSYTEIFDEVARKNYLTATGERMMFDLHRARDRVYRDVKRKGLDSCRKQWLPKKPTVRMDYEFREIATGRVVKVRNSLKFPRKAFPADKFVRISEFARCSLQELFQHSQRLHGNNYEFVPKPHNNKLDLFMDGVPCAKSASDKLDVVSIRFQDCDLIYVHSMHVYKKDTNLTPVQVLESLIKEAKGFEFNINRVIGDAPIRARLKCLKLHSGYYSCECCFAKGEQALSSRKVVFPSSTMRADARTDHWWNRTVEKIYENGGTVNMDDEELKGMTGISPLSVKLPGDSMYFSMSKKFTVEPMHNIGGCIKQLLRLLFQLPKSSQKLSAEQTRKLRLLDKRWTQIKLPREFNRRNREILRNYKHLKSQEYFSIAGAGFLAVANAMDLKDDTRKREVWLRFCFIVRLAMFPNRMWAMFKVKVGIWMKIWHFYTAFEQVFGVDECSWNIHTFSHLIQLRDVSNLPDGSALMFEGAFNYMKKIMKTNTPSFAKQVIEKMTANNVRSHSCKPVVRFSARDRARYADNMIYTETGDFYLIDSIEGDHYNAKKFLTSKFVTPEDKGLNWDLVGVRLVHQLKSEIHQVRKVDVVGKATIDDTVIIAMPFAYAFV